ncbi:MAG: helix-turn-helix domain-containing protein [Candidatus Dormibacteria bacterium]
MVSPDVADDLDVRQAAALTRRSTETVRRWIWSGELRAHRQGHRLMITRPDLDAWLASRERPVPMSLRRWVEELEAIPPSQPAARRGSAADLVLQDRRARSGEATDSRR